MSIDDIKWPLEKGVGSRRDYYESDGNHPSRFEIDAYCDGLYDYVKEMEAHLEACYACNEIVQEIRREMGDYFQALGKAYKYGVEKTEFIHSIGFLFPLDRKYGKELDRRVITEELRAEFLDADINLSENAIVEKIVNETGMWIIIDQRESRKYCITMEKFDDKDWFGSNDMLHVWKV